MATEFRKEFIISSYELNPGGKARLTTMANYFQEIAYHHATELGFGYHQMKERQTLWMLSRMKIRMNKYPAWNDHIVIETWPSGVNKLFALRDFRVSDPSGNILGVASTCWLIVDLQSHRPVRPGIELKRFSSIDYGDPVFENNLEKIELPGQMVNLGSHRVVFSDLDIVGHVNNVKYIEWSVDAAKQDGFLDRAIGDFEINFLHEAQLGNHVEMKGIEDTPEHSGEEKTMTLKASRKEDGQELIRARISWDPRE